MFESFVELELFDDVLKFCFLDELVLLDPIIEDWDNGNTGVSDSRDPSVE